ncbi:hypothetical protein L195_g035587, partial [Trifolium pratense]
EPKVLSWNRSEQRLKIEPCLFYEWSLGTVDLFCALRRRSFPPLIFVLDAAAMVLCGLVFPVMVVWRFVDCFVGLCGRVYSFCVVAAPV